jgi:hypothetical protein
VRLKLLVNPNGVVTQVLEPSGHPLLVRAAEEAARQDRYRPFEVGGLPTTVLVEASVSFSLIHESASASIPFSEETELDSVLIEYGDGGFGLRIRETIWLSTMAFQEPGIVVTKGQPMTPRSIGWVTASSGNFSLRYCSRRELRCWLPAMNLGVHNKVPPTIAPTPGNSNTQGMIFCQRSC